MDVGLDIRREIMDMMSIFTHRQRHGHTFVMDVTWMWVWTYGHDKGGKMWIGKYINRFLD
jgi:hypothetical protein